MGPSSLRTRLAALVLAGVWCAISAHHASADVHVQSTASRNRIDMHWWFPCSSTPSAGGHYDTMTVGRPPDNLVAYIVEHDPDNPANEARIAGGVLNGDEFTHVETDGCAAAGGNGIFRATAVRPWANVGTEAQPLKFAITRTVVPGPAPDLVTVTYVSGTFQTFTAGASDQARATLKLIVYPDQSTADADAGLDGVGSAFYGAATLLGGSGRPASSQGLSLGDFTIVGDGTGLFTATPILGFSRSSRCPTRTRRRSAWSPIRRSRMDRERAPRASPAPALRRTRGSRPPRPIRRVARRASGSPSLGKVT